MKPEAEDPKYSWSTDGEFYHGSFDTPEAAAADVLAEAFIGETVWIGENIKPNPADFVDAENFLEHIQCQDEFRAEWATDWPGASKEQLADLQARLANTLTEWINAYDLHPTFYNIINPVEWIKGDGGQPEPRARTSKDHS